MGKRGERSAGRTSRFSLTCRLLSRYLKKNGNRENSPVPNTAGFEPGVGGVSGKNHHHHHHRHAENSTLAEEESNAATNTKQKWKDQLTVFYGGKVVVFDNFPADTAKDLMLMASEDTAADPTATRDLTTPQRSRPKPTQANDSSGDCHRLHALGHGTPSMTDMPIARRNSLHRFLEKRKDRFALVARDVELRSNDLQLTLVFLELLGWARHRTESMAARRWRRRRKTGRGSAWAD